MNSSKQDKEKDNSLNNNNSNKGKYKTAKKDINKKQYFSTINLNTTKLSQKRNIDNNIDNNLSNDNTPDNQNKELISSFSTNNLEDLDEKLDIKLPYNYNNNSNMHSSITTQINLNNSLNQSFNSNFREKIISKTLEKKSNNDKASYNDQFYSNFSFLNKVNLFFENLNIKSKTMTNKYIYNKKLEDRNNNKGKNVIYKKRRNTEDNILENKMSNNDSFKTKNFYSKANDPFLNHFNRYLNETFEKKSTEKKNNIYYSKGSSNLKMKYNNENKDNTNNNHINFNIQFYSTTRKGFQHQFNRNHNYIQKIMERLPKSSSKNMGTNYNYDHKINHNQDCYKKLSNLDNNKEYYFGFNNINDNKRKYNNYFRKGINKNNMNKINFYLNNGNINNSQIKAKNLSVEKQRPNNDMKYINLKISNKNNFFEENNINDIYHQTFVGGMYKKSRSQRKNSSMKSALGSIKKKNYSEFIFNIYNRRFKRLLFEFLDKKSILNLSETCVEFFKISRNFFYNKIYNKLIEDKNKIQFINKILRNTRKFCSEKIKQKIENNLIKAFYKQLLFKNETYDEFILKDLPRTFPNEESFNEGKTNFNKLYHILTCYSNFNQKIGYVQGMNFICGRAIYLFNSEEEVFVFLDGFLNLMKMFNYLSVNNEKKVLHFLNDVSRIFEKYIPDIAEYLNEKGLSHDFFSVRWVFTLFSSSLERNNLAIVWSLIIIFKWKFVFSFIIQILKKYQKYICNLSETQICNKMKDLLGTKYFKNDFKEIIRSTLNFMKNNIIL